MAQAQTNDKEILAAWVADINAGKYQRLTKCEAAANTVDTELFVQNKDGFVACVPIGFIKAHDDTDTVVDELAAQIEAWTGIGKIWTAEPANKLIH